MIESSKRHLATTFAFIAIAVFFFIKIPNITYRFGDGNAYLYMAKMFAEGHIPYRDFFLADPPLLVLFLVPFSIIFGAKLLSFQLIPIILEGGTAYLIFLISRKKGESLAFLAPLVYLFSFTILATSDYLTGIQLTIFLVTLGIYLHESKKFFFSGFSFMLACLTKLYVFPAFVGFLANDLISKKYRKFFHYILGSVLAFSIILLPFLLISFSSIWKYMVIHQLHRPPGLDKWYVWSFFFGKEWFLIFGGIVGLFVRKNRHLVLPFALTALFFLIFPDLYYLYLESLLPFLVLGIISALSLLYENKVSAAVMPIAVAYLMYAVLGAVTYKNDFYTSDRFLNVNQVTEKVRSLPPGPLYGSHEIAPLIALTSGRRLAGNYIDTNTQAFASGGEDLRKASENAIKEGAYLIGKVTDLPRYDIKDFGMKGYFDMSLFSHCNVVAKLPSTSGGQDNFIGIYKCSQI